MIRSAAGPLLLFGFPALAQVVPASDQRIIPGIPADEYVDVTGDSIADLLISSRTVRISDPQQPGYLGLYKLGVRTLSGNSVLQWSTPSNQRWFNLDDSVRLDTAELAVRIHFKQLSWTDPDRPTEFWLLERPFGPAITKDQDGWYGTGEQYEGTLVLRSANERGTSVAAFSFELPYPYGRIAIHVKDAVRVPNDYGEEGDPVLTRPKVVDPPYFGHEAIAPQVVVPPGIAPDERVNLNGDEVDDVVITGHKELAHGTGVPSQYVRGFSPLPGTMLLMTVERWGVKDFFRLREGEVLTPERLANGLMGNVLEWVPAGQERVFVPVMRHPFGSPDEPQGWAYHADALDGALVYRTMEYDRPIIGALQIISEGTGGQFGAMPQSWVEEGQVLELR